MNHQNNQEQLGRVGTAHRLWRIISTGGQCQPYRYPAIFYIKSQSAMKSIHKPLVLLTDIHGCSKNIEWYLINN